MRILVSEKISPHKYKTPEGYLICADAILARTGKQEYKRSELFGDACDNPDEIIEVDRPSEEVFSPKTMASFENKPVTIEHPDEDVNVENYKLYAVGFLRDVRKATIDGREVMVGNLVITDKDAIKAIETGELTDLSCGYDCDIADVEHPSQSHIQGNHIALCEEGRAGIARIVDSKVEDSIKDGWRRFDYEDYSPDDVVTVVITDRRFEPLFDRSQRESLKKHNVKIQAHCINGTVVRGRVSDIIKVCDECYVMNPTDILDSNDSKSKISDGWSGIRNGIIYSYENGYFYITHKNGKVEKLPGDTFSRIDELYEYVENIKDNKSKDAMQATLEHSINKDSIVKDDWVIKNTGLAYEVWYDNKMIKKFATKKQAIEWIQDRFPEDNIIKDSKKYGFKIILNTNKVYPLQSVLDVANEEFTFKYRIIHEFDDYKWEVRFYDIDSLSELHSLLDWLKRKTYTAGINIFTTDSSIDKYSKIYNVIMNISKFKDSNKLKLRKEKKRL